MAPRTLAPRRETTSASFPTCNRVSLPDGLSPCAVPRKKPNFPKPSLQVSVRTDLDRQETGIEFQPAKPCSVITHHASRHPTPVHGDCQTVPEVYMSFGGPDPAPRPLEATTVSVPHSRDSTN